MSNLQVVGRGVPRNDAVEKVTGRALFGTDLVIPGMLHAKVLRSPLPHARLLHIDAKRAQGLPGVVCILTREDLKDLDPYYGTAFRDQPILAMDRVRYEGEPVAAVAAVDEATAEEALELIRVDYEELPGVFTLEEALTPGAPLVHETPLPPSGHFRDLASLKPVEGTNICHHFHYKRGDVEEGFARSDLVVEETYTFPMVYHYSMEPHVVIARVERDHIFLWASTQHPFPVRKELATLFGLPLSQVHISVPYIGGAYGCKSYTKLEPLAVALARKARRPVRLVLSVEEAFRTGRRTAVRYHLKTGVKKDGTLVARKCELYYQLGAYADVGPRIAQKSGYTAAGPYRIPHLQVDSYAVYTNTAPCAAFRGYGVPQVTWAYESQMDTIAHELGMDPMELRLKNLLRRGEEFMPGDLPMDADLEMGLKKVARAIQWERQPQVPGRGKGLACALKAPLAPSLSQAVVRMHADGTVTLLTGTVEIGQGAKTILAQVVAEELEVPLERVRVLETNTQMVPYDQATSSSRSTALMGLAVQRGARQLKTKLLALAAELLETPPEKLEIRQGNIVARKEEIPLKELITRHFGMPGGELLEEGIYAGQRGEALLGGVAPFWEVGMGAAEVEVDPETGEVVVHRYVSLADAGRAINPQLCEAQDEGAAMQGLGHTLFEEMVYQKGQLLNANLLDYRVPTFVHLPEEFHSILLENEDGPGPFGAKGVGEGGIIPVAPAVANALYHATGVRIRDLPLTPERVWRALRETAPMG